jgi:tetratricopeptide (TPR) repeat protein
MRQQPALWRLSIPGRWPSAAIFAVFSALVLVPGCSAGPPADEFPRAGEDTLTEGPGFWPDQLDRVVFGAQQEATGAREEGCPFVSLLERARQAVEEDRLTDAAGLLDAAVGTAPPERVWIPRRALGDVSLALRRDEDALRRYQQVASDPNARGLASLYSNLAVAYHRLGDSQRSRSAAERSLELEPGHPEALRTLGLLDLESGDLEAARQRFRAAADSGRVVPEAEVALAELEERDGDLRKALARYGRLLETYESLKARDHHRRWRDLFYPSRRGTAAELKARRERLQGLLDGRPPPERDVRNPRPK